MRALQALQGLAHQSYAPVLGLYLEAMNHVRLERFRKLHATLDKADALLAETRQRNARIAATLDKAEAEQVSRDLFFLFHDYFQTLDQVQLLRAMQVQRAQGYAFACPLQGPQLLDCLRRGPFLVPDGAGASVATSVPSEAVTSGTPPAVVTLPESVSWTSNPHGKTTEVLD